MGSETGGGGVEARASAVVDWQAEKRRVRVLALGAGVQSTTVLLMSCRGDLPGLADVDWRVDDGASDGDGDWTGFCHV